MNRGFRTSTFALALVLGASTGCGSSKSPEAQAMDMMGSLIPNVYVKLVLKVIRLEALRIKVRDHGCGAVLHWLKGQIQIRPEAFRVTWQGG
jgi:hypothetical protein